MSKILTLMRGCGGKLGDCQDLRCIVVAEGNAPEDHVEEEKHHEVDDPPEVVNLVSFNPIRVPARILTEGVDLLTLLLHLLVPVLDKSQSRVYSLGLSTEQGI